MSHKAIDQVMQRVAIAKQDSDHTFFHTLLLAGEALAKTVVLGIVAAIGDDKDRHHYRLEHKLVRADGLGEWSEVLEDALVGPASQFMLHEARAESTELTRACRSGEWQFEAVSSLKAALDELGIPADEVPAKTDMRRWFRLLVALRNGTRGHGAELPSKLKLAAVHLERSLQTFIAHHVLFRRTWAHVHRQISGKYRVTPFCGDGREFEVLTREADLTVPDGAYVWYGKARPIRLFKTDEYHQDFLFPNGNFSSKRFELLSYASGSKIDGESSNYLLPPGQLPRSETEGHGELLLKGNCFSNAPEVGRDYVSRPTMERELFDLLMDERRPVITLLGRGGIGKTYLALKVIRSLYEHQRFDAVIWFSARDVDLQLSGPKAVRQRVLTPDDMAMMYCSLVLPPAQVGEKGFNPRKHLERELQASAIGSCLFVFDNFETTQEPVEMFRWIDTYVRLPNKVLITTRLREFKGDYPVDVHGMEDPEARTLVRQTAEHLGITGLMTEQYVTELIAEAAGHPYVIKILLGEVAKAGRAANVPRLIAGSDEVLTALFERTYASLTPCAQRAFLTLSAWNSPVPKIALEAVLLKSTQERQEVERGVESLLQYSLADLMQGPDKQDFISLPLVASSFGKRKLQLSQAKASIESDVEILQMLGPSPRNETHLGLAKRLERFIENMSRRIDSGEGYDRFAPVLEMICRAYSPGWLLLARWHMERGTDDNVKKAKDELSRFLENNPATNDASEAWALLAQAHLRMGDYLSEIHALIELAQFPSTLFHQLSTTANKLNGYLFKRTLAVDDDEKRKMIQRIADVLEERQSEASATDFSRMAWLALHLKQDSKAKEFVEAGLQLDPDHIDCKNLLEKLSRGTSARERPGSA